VREQLVFHGRACDDALESHVSLSWRVDSWEKIAQQSEEDVQVLEGDFRNVKVSQGSHKQGLLTDGGLCSLETSGHDQHGFDGS
jgi:hypothetical protein